MRSQPSLSNFGDRIGEALQRKADAPIKPRAAQAACDVGLFGDTQNQHDLFDQLLRDCFARRP